MHACVWRGTDMFFTVYVYCQVLCNLIMAVNTVDCPGDTADFCRPLFFDPAESQDTSFSVFASTQCFSQFMAAAMFSRGQAIPLARRWSVL